MKIAWFCIPAHGHTNPTLGIVKELTSAGHQVCYFSFEMFREKIEQGAVEKRTEELGAGVMLTSISEEDILQALTKVLTEPSYKENAVKISESFRGCGGEKEAGAFLEEIAAKQE